jgi:hypothetical protein
VGAVAPPLIIAPPACIFTATQRRDKGILDHHSWTQSPPKVPYPAAASPPGSAHEAVVTEDGPHQAVELEP